MIINYYRNFGDVYASLEEIIESGVKNDKVYTLQKLCIPRGNCILKNNNANTCGGLF